MGKSEALQAVGFLVSAYGRENVTEDQVNAYVDALGDVDGELLMATARRLVRTHKFFPAISEIRHEAARIAGVMPVSKAEAMAIVRRADRSESVFRRDGTLAYTERYWEWPEDVTEGTMNLIRIALSKVGEPVNADGKPLFGWELGFQEIYERESGEEMKRMLTDLSRARLPDGSRGLLAGGENG